MIIRQDYEFELFIVKEACKIAKFLALVQNSEGRILNIAGDFGRDETIIITIEIPDLSWISSFDEYKA